MLYDRMMEVPPDGSRTLSLKEMEALGMGLHDPVYDEYVQNARAARAGLTKEQWIRMTQETTARCGGDLLGVMPKSDAERRRACWQQSFPAWFIPYQE
jgi:hypothetical protein